ncbi:MAG: HAMP domain-containing histidine kinase, partial [Chloroflexota bacterium]|nr:HAMP domain-containing histidine kinase [Chloroflexota bacterium]
QRTFVEAAAHDLRNPLTAIRGQAQMLRRKARKGNVPSPEQLAEDLAGIEGAAGRITALLEELQDAAELRAGQPLELHTTPTDLVELARSAAADAQATTGHHRIRVDAAQEKLVAPADPARLQRVLDNILGNAVKYSPKRGRITVTVRREEHLDGTHAVLAVRDEGVGIPAADLPHIFERHWRGTNVTERIRGTGVGLAGAHQIVTQHAARLWWRARKIRAAGSSSRCRSIPSRGEARLAQVSGSWATLAALVAGNRARRASPLPLNAARNRCHTRGQMRGRTSRS